MLGPLMEGITGYWPTGELGVAGLEALSWKLSLLTIPVTVGMNCGLAVPKGRLPLGAVIVKGAGVIVSVPFTAVTV
jgi:hypothetical protein